MGVHIRERFFRLIGWLRGGLLAARGEISLVGFGALLTVYSRSEFRNLFCERLYRGYIRGGMITFDVRGSQGNYCTTRTSLVVLVPNFGWEIS